MFRNQGLSAFSQKSVEFSSLYQLDREKEQVLMNMSRPTCPLRYAEAGSGSSGETILYS